MDADLALVTVLHPPRVQPPPLPAVLREVEVVYESYADAEELTAALALEDRTDGLLHLVLLAEPRVPAGERGRQDVQALLHAAYALRRTAALIVVCPQPPGEGPTDLLARIANYAEPSPSQALERVVELLGREALAEPPPPPWHQLQAPRPGGQG